MTNNHQIPSDIIECAAKFDERWPLQESLSDRPYRMKSWGRDHQDFIEAMASAGVPTMNGSAWFRSSGDAMTTRKLLRHLTAMTVLYGPGCEDGDMDGREIATRVAEIHLPDGRRHLLAYDDEGPSAETLRYIWFDGNWSCDCNRAIDLARDGVDDLGDWGDSCMPEGGNGPALRLGWLVLRFRHLVTGRIRFEVVADADGNACDEVTP